MAMAQDLSREQPDGDRQLPGKLWASLVQAAGPDRVLAAARDIGLFDPQVRRSRPDESYQYQATAQCLQL
jgi:hypothetical protein